MTISSDDRVLGAALGLSILLHAAMLSVHFKFPDPLQWKAANQPLEVVLVNAKTREKPAEADILAQANLDRGGNVDERRRARSPLPVTQPKQPGRDLAEAQRRVRELEARQQELLSMAREAETKQSARGRMYGNLRLTVTIRPDGNVESIELDRSSGLKVLDAAAFKIVRMATPFAAFPPDIQRDTDLLVITRTWFFGQGDKIWTE